jgi:hypothetical protein
MKASPGSSPLPWPANSAGDSPEGVSVDALSVDSLSVVEAARSIAVTAAGLISGRFLAVARWKRNR